MKNHDCQEILKKVHNLLDGELPAQEEVNAIEEIEKCLYCLESYELEKRFIAFLKNRLIKRKMPQSVLENILKELDKKMT